MLAQGVMTAFGEVGLVHPEAAAWATPAALAAFLLVRLRAGPRRPRRAGG
jgi:hypothetical protein